MKANKTPKKIYIEPNLDSIWGMTERSCESEIEYTRTDAFIDKVAEWMYDNLQTVRDVNNPAAHHVESIPALGIITQTEFVETFKKEIRYLL